MNTNERTTYFGVYSDIGFGIFSSLELLKEKTASAKERHIHKFYDLKYAGIYAMTGYNGYNSALKQPIYEIAPEPYEIDKIYKAD